MTERPARPPAPTDWASLVEAGVARIEALAGDTWTDFNEHDPGVTLLHALAYGLTDLGYRAGHPVADLLTGPDGQIDADGGCLYPPDRIFPCAPVSLLDLRKRLLDEMPGLRNVWIDRSPSDDPALTGRYRVWLLPGPGAGGTRADLISTAERLLSSMRPLGDVFDEVGLFSTVTLSLSIHATTSPDRTLDEILKDAQATVAAALCPPIVFQPRTGPLAPTLPPDVLYEGPWLVHGFLGDEALWSPRQEADVEDLVREALERTDGIEDIASLSITFLSARPPTDPSPQAFTWDAYADHNELHFNDRIHVPAASSFPGSSDQAGAGAGAASPAILKPAPEARGSAAAPPAGVFVDAGRHDAVQDSLPPSYGLEKNGLPPDASAQRIAEVRQLRGYLFVFEQILANRFAQLAHAQKLLSWRDEPTHVWQSLEALTGADEVLDGPYAAGVQAVVTSWNQAYSQEEAVADHLLARFAESLPSLDWQNFETLSQKRSFLEHYPELGQNRQIGFDVARARRQGGPDPDNASWLERKLDLLLAAGPRQPLRAYRGEAAAALEGSAAAGYQIYLGRSYYLLEHQLFIDGSTPPGDDRSGAVKVPKAFFAARLSHVLTNWTFCDLRPEFQAYVESFLRDAAPAHLVHRFLWCSAPQMDVFAGYLAAWYGDYLRPLIVEAQDRHTLWVRPTGAAWDVVRTLLSFPPADEAPG
ncbi:MAG TPA: hypothetical protein VLA59_06495 [Patescibacteria group bacterium]|nr:hypothetical protein [Patescibacteria group bacterium]